jgi:GNAT superfamily N-acetyltransferase
MTDKRTAHAAVLDTIEDIAYPIWHEGLERDAYRKFHTALMKTAWGRLHQGRFALMDGEDLLASAVQYDLAGRIEGRPVRICGIGSVFTAPAHRGAGHARALLAKVVDQATSRGVDMALLFSHSGLEEDALDGFELVSRADSTLEVEQSPRHGAPMTMVRGGEERDLPAIAAMGRVRADPFRFHLDRDVDLIQYAVTRKRLLAGLGTANARQLHFFIAEEGTTAAAYVVVSVAGDDWTLEECGDRDPSGARVGALLQALIAREPVERRPTIRGWLPPRFLPPQAAISSSSASTDVMMARMLGDGATLPGFSAGDVLYWGNDVF